MTTIPSVDEFATQYAEGVDPFPFVEDENGNITAYGHQNKAEFAAEVNRYDEVANGYAADEDDQWTADSVYHHYVTVGEDGESLRDADENTPGAFPVTILWGQR